MQLRRKLPADPGGDGYGCDGLGYLYDNGLGVKKDHERAAQLRFKGCESGSMPARRPFQPIESVDNCGPVCIRQLSGPREYKFGHKTKCRTYPTAMPGERVAR